MARNDLRCGDPTCPHSAPEGAFVERGDGDGYAAALRHKEDTGHDIAGWFVDGQLEKQGLRGTKGLMVARGAIRSAKPSVAAPPGDPPGGATAEDAAASTPPSADDQQANDPAADQGGDDEDDLPGSDEDPFGDGEDEPDGEDVDADGNSMTGLPPSPRGRRPTVTAAIRAWMPYPVIEISDTIGFLADAHFRATRARLQGDDDQGNPLRDLLEMPKATALARWLESVVWRDVRAHPEMYDLGGLMQDEQAARLREQEAALLRLQAQVESDRKAALTAWAEAERAKAELVAHMAAMQPQGSARRMTA